MGVALWLVRLATLLVPGDCRREWSREWVAELHARRGEAPRRLILFAIGAPVHALWLRRQLWTPGAIGADLAAAARALRTRPASLFASVGMLAVALGAAIVVNTLVEAVWRRPLPYREPERLVEIWESSPRLGWAQATVSPANLRDWQARQQSFVAMAWYVGRGVTSVEPEPDDLTLSGRRPMHVHGLRVSPNFFEVLGVRPLLGRTFAAGEDAPGARPVTVITERLWRTIFAGDPRVIGRTVQLNLQDVTVIGVMPDAFWFGNVTTNLWRPFVASDSRWQQRRPHFLRVVARLVPGVSVAQARQDMAAIASDLEREFPYFNTDLSVGLGPLHDWMVGWSTPVLRLMASVVALMMLMSCANVAGLLFVRGLDRVRELEVRLALGATRVRLLRQLGFEAGLLVVAAMGGGLLLAGSLLAALERTAAFDLPRFGEAGLSLSMLAPVASLLVGTTLLTGMWPAWRSTAAAQTDCRSGDGRTVTRAQPIRRLLVGIEIALATVVLTGTGLAVATAVRLANVDPGFAAGDALAVRLDLPGARFGEQFQALGFYDAFLARLRALDAVEAAGGTSLLPLSGYAWTSGVYVDHRPDDVFREVRHKEITAGFFDAMGVPLLAGRHLTESDRADAVPVVVVNETLAREIAPDREALGVRIAYDEPASDPTWWTVVGVVGDQRQGGLAARVRPEVYTSHRQRYQNALTIVVRSSGPAARLESSVLAILRDLDPDVVPFGVRTIATHVRASFAREELAARLFGALSVVSLILACVGVYGLAAASVASRVREFGVRLALGATGTDIGRLVLRRELTLVALGLAGGLALAVGLASFWASWLFEVSPADPATLTIVSGVLLATTIGACAIPARRATRVDPADALRAD